MVKNLPAMQETWVQSLDWEFPLDEGMVTHSSLLAWRIPMDRGAWWAGHDWVTRHINIMKYTFILLTSPRRFLTLWVSPWFPWAIVWIIIYSLIKLQISFICPEISHLPKMCSCTLKNAEFKGTDPLCSRKSCIIITNPLYLWFLPIHSFTSTDSTNHSSYDTVIFTAEKELRHKWTLAVQTHVVQGSTLLSAFSVSDTVWCVRGC